MITGYGGSAGRIQPDLGCENITGREDLGRRVQAVELGYHRKTATPAACAEHRDVCIGRAWAGVRATEQATKATASHWESVFTRRFLRCVIDIYTTVAP